MANFTNPTTSFLKIISPVSFTQKLSWFSQLKIRHFIVFSLALLPTLAFAAGDTPVSQGLGYFINAIYGTTGLSIATVAIIVVGLLCAGHYLEWKRLFQTIVGIGIMFGAGGIAAAIQMLITQ